MTGVAGVSQPPERAPGVASRVLGTFNIFIDPEGAANNVRLSWSWLPPLLLSGMIIGVCNYLLVPVTLRVMQIDPPGNMTVAELERVLPAIEFSQKIRLVPMRHRSSSRLSSSSRRQS